MAQSIRKPIQIDSNDSSRVLFVRILKFILPLILSNVLQHFYHASDVMIVGMSTEPDAVGAVGSTGSFLSLIRTLFINFSVGVNVSVSRCLGKKDNENCSKAVHTAICMSLLFGSLGTVVGISLTKSVLTAMGYQKHLLELAIRYAYIYLAGLPLLALTNFLIAILQAQENTKISMYVLTATGLLNVILNLFFVKVTGMSVEGVALATNIARLASTIVLLRYLVKKGNNCRIDFKKLRIHKKQFVEITRIGFPAGIQSAMFSLSGMLIQTSILQINNTITPPNSAYAPVVRGNSAASSLEHFVYQAIAAVTVTATVFTAKTSSAGNYRQTRRCTQLIAAIGIGIAFLIASLFILLRDPLLVLYGVNKATDSLSIIAYDTAITRIFLMWPPLVFYAFMCSLSGTIRGFGRSSLSAIVTFFGTCVLRIVWIYTIFALIPTLEVVYLSFSVSWVVTSMIFLTIVLRIFRNKDKGNELIK